jgi:hypothetical protein
MGRALVFISLIGLLAGALVLAYVTWTSVEATIPPAVYVIMALGVVVTLGVGAGLMGLVFYSSRRGYDDEAGRQFTDQN